MASSTRVRNPLRAWLGATARTAILGSVLATWLIACGETPLSVRYDGQTLFSGIIFGTNPVAQQLPEVWFANGASFHEVNGAARQALESTVIEGLRRHDPQFFIRFEQGVTSGNVALVEATITDAVTQTRRLIVASHSDPRVSAVIDPSNGTFAYETSDSVIYRESTTFIALTRESIYIDIFGQENLTTARQTPLLWETLIASVTGRFRRD